MTDTFHTAESLESEFLTACCSLQVVPSRLPDGQVVFLLPSHYVQLAAAAAAGGPGPYLDADPKATPGAVPGAVPGVALKETTPVRDTVLKEPMRDPAREKEVVKEVVKEAVKVEAVDVSSIHRGKLRHHRKPSVLQEARDGLREEPREEAQDLVVAKNPDVEMKTEIKEEAEDRQEDDQEHDQEHEEGGDDAPLDFTTGERKLRDDRPPRALKREATSPPAREVHLKVPRPWTMPGPEDGDAEGHPVYDDDGNVWRPW